MNGLVNPKVFGINAMCNVRRLVQCTVYIIHTSTTTSTVALHATTAVPVSIRYRVPVYVYTQQYIHVYRCMYLHVGVQAKILPKSHNYIRYLCGTGTTCTPVVVHVPIQPCIYLHHITSILR